MARALESLCDREDQVAWQKDLAWLNDELKKNPDKLRRVRSVVQLDIEKNKNRDLELNGDLFNRSLKRLPPHFLIKDMLPRLVNLTKEELEA